MSTSEIHSSPAAQWLQGLLAKGAPSQAGSQSSHGSAELPRDSTRISAQAFQLNQAAGASLTTHSRSAQALGVLPAHHDHSVGRERSDPSFANTVAQAIVVSTLPQPTRIDGSVNADSVSSAASSDSRERGFIEERVSKIANDVRAAYSHVTAPEAASPHNRGVRSINLTA